MVIKNEKNNSISPNNSENSLNCKKLGKIKYFLNFQLFPLFLRA